MKIIFMGTPDFAVPALLNLSKSGYKPAAVVTGMDKKRGRGQKLIPTPVKVAASTLDIPVFEPKKLKDPSFIDKITELNADLTCVVAFRILPESLINIPKKGSINLHSSLLPHYRGAAPIQRAIMAGETETGVTTFYIKRKVDTGNILLQKRISIGANENFGSLHNRLATAGADLLLETVRGIETDTLEEIPQDDSLSSDAPKIKNEDLTIIWENSANNIHNRVRALSPYPGMVTQFGRSKVKIFKTVLNDRFSAVPGEVIEVTDKYFTISAVNGSLDILELQREGKKRMTAEQYLRGTKIVKGDKFV